MDLRDDNETVKSENSVKRPEVCCSSDHDVKKNICLMDPKQQ
jgi:hypothetical protein